MTKVRNTINSKSSVSIPAQLRELILEDIAAQAYKPGERFETERGLAERFGVSRASVRETIGSLIDSGMLVRTTGRGTFVADLATREKPQKIVILISAEILHFTSGYGLVMRGAESTCYKSGDTLILRVVGNEPFEINKRHDALPDGVIIIGGVRKDVAQRYRDLHVPIALVDLLERQETSEVEAVRIDYASGTTVALERLHDLGHRKIGFIGFSGSHKYELYWQSLERLGIEYYPGCVEFLHPLDLEPGVLSGLRRMQAILARGRRPTAVLATNDFVALGALEALTIAGLQVPKDVSIIGYDDLKASTSPLLSTICADLEAVGRMAVSALHRRIRGHLHDAPIVLPVQFIERGSSGAAQSSELSTS
jgi:GntR family transcriptional regulator, arabinose operon transcriptional repressor